MKEVTIMDKVYRDIINERIDHYGVSTLADEEVICILTGIPVLEIKNNIDNYGLPELIKFTSAFGITKAQRKKLELLFHVAKRINASDFKERVILNSSIKAGEYFSKELQFFRNEVFALALLDSQNRLIKTEIVSEGTINEAHVYPREIVKTVLDNNSRSVILAHNHPGGSMQPSSADIDVTQKVELALNTISVSILDHIIVAEKGYMSFFEQGLLNT